MYIRVYIYWPCTETNIWLRDGEWLSSLKDVGNTRIKPRRCLPPSALRKPRLKKELSLRKQKKCSWKFNRNFWARRTPNIFEYRINFNGFQNDFVSNNCSTNFDYYDHRIYGSESPKRVKKHSLNVRYYIAQNVYCTTSGT